jgi:hypothetical protein
MPNQKHYESTQADSTLDKQWHGPGRLYKGVVEGPPPIAKVTMRPVTTLNLGCILMDLIPFVSVILHVHISCVGLFRYWREFLFAPLRRKKLFGAGLSKRRL